MCKTFHQCSQQHQLHSDTRSTCPAKVVFEILLGVVVTNAVVWWLWPEPSVVTTQLLCSSSAQALGYNATADWLTCFVKNFVSLIIFRDRMHRTGQCLKGFLCWTFKVQSLCLFGQKCLLKWLNLLLVTDILYICGCFWVRWFLFIQKCWTTITQHFVTSWQPC